MTDEHEGRLAALLEPMIRQNWQTYWEPLFTREPDRLLELCGHGRFAAELMLALEHFAACGLGLGDDTARRGWQAMLAAHLRAVFTEVGGFAWTGHHGQERNRAVDTNEVASVVEYLCRLRALAPDLPADLVALGDDIIPPCCDLTLGARADARPGAILKSTTHDTEILNTTATAAAALLTAARAGFVDADRAAAVAAASRAHLTERFGRHAPGWWPYSESLQEANVVLGVSLNYQAVTLLGFARLLPTPPSPEALGVVEQAAATLAGAINPDGSCHWATAEERLDHRGYPQVCAVTALVAAARLTGRDDLRDPAERLLRHIAGRQFQRGKFVFELIPRSTGPALFRDSTVQVSLFYLCTALLQSLQDASHPIPYPG